MCVIAGEVGGIILMCDLKTYVYINVFFLNKKPKSNVPPVRYRSHSTCGSALKLREYFGLVRG